MMGPDYYGRSKPGEEIVLRDERLRYTGTVDPTWYTWNHSVPKI